MFHRQALPDVLVAPMILVGATDSVHFTKISNHVFRFLPMRFKSSGSISISAFLPALTSLSRSMFVVDIDRVHGYNERVHLDVCDFVLIHFVGAIDHFVPNLCMSHLLLLVRFTTRR